MPSSARQTKNERLVLLDAHAIIHRAYHALPDFTSSKGEPTGALYGLSSMLAKIISDLKPDYIVACFDLPEKTFRHEAYENYKAGRKKADGALVSQLDRARDVFKALGIPVYDKPGFEADDMLGTIVTQLKKRKDLDIVIASGDMDTLQLVDKKRVQVFTLKKGINDTVMYDEAAVVSRFGFGPKLLPDYKGLRGDPSDNIVGIAGIGEKTATTLIQSFGSIEKIYAQLKKDPEALRAAGLTPRIIGLLQEGEEEALFSKTLATIRTDAPIDFVLPDIHWRDGCSREDVEALFRELEFKSLVDRFHALLSSAGERRQEEGGDLVRQAVEAASPEDIEKAKVAFWLLDSEKTNPSVEDVLEATEASSVAEALKTLEERIRENSLSFAYENIEVPLIPVVAKMNSRGIMLDTKYLAKMSKEYHAALEKIQGRIWKMAGREFNINSPKQLSEILFDTLQLTAKGLKKSEGGQRSTRITELEKLKDAHPIIREIMDYRELQKLLSTYIDTLPHLLDEDGRLRTQFIQAGTTTGRFSSINPNMQNIPIKSDLGKNIRRAFVATPGHVFAALDYSQIELRIAALLSGDPGLTQTFIEGKDIHSSVAARVFGVAEGDVTPEMRRRAKVINFGIIYGMGVLALKQNLGTGRAEAEQFYHSYFEAFPAMQAYLESVKAFARKNGYTETLFGRRRYFPAIKSNVPFMRATAERMATNAPIQGTEADIIKLAMVSVDAELKERGWADDAHLVLQVHDELVYEIRKEKAEEISGVIRRCMEDIIPPAFLEGKTSVPILVEAALADTWGGVK